MATLDDYHWLVSDAATPWLAIAKQEMSTNGATFLALTSRLRRDLSAEQTHLVIEQMELRHRARNKFLLADKLFFTRKGLEQATDEQVANYKSSRFPVGETVADLCCGIGGDLIAFARRGPARGIEMDSVTALLAAANTAALDCQQGDCSVINADATQAALAGNVWHCDPDRRKDGRRATRGERFDPPLEALARILKQVNHAAIKLAPATEAPPDWKEQVELEWISSRGECRQQVAWFGRLARHPGQHSATLIRTSGPARTFVGLPDGSFPVADGLGRYLYEPDPAVLAARLTAALCLHYSLAAISPGIPYLTSDARLDDPALGGFEVLDVLPLDRKQLKAYCREHALGQLEIKKRGVDIAPQQLRKQIVARGDGTATILLAPIQGNTRAIVARRA